MALKDLLQTMGVFIALGISLFTLIKAAKMFPVEHATIDAGASKIYAEAAKLAAEQVKEALERIETLERRSVSMENEVKGLHRSIEVRDRELAQRDELLKEWAAGIKVLIRQLYDANLKPLWEPRSVNFRPPG